jgi:hypothetical protein
MILQPFVAEVDLAQLSSRIVRLQPQAGEHAHDRMGSLLVDLFGPNLP